MDQPHHHRRQRLIALISTALLLSGCATLPRDFARTESHALTATADTALGKVVANKAADHSRPPGQSGFHLLGSGVDAFVARAVLAHEAERSLDVQYYLYHNDLVGKLFTEQLIRAAERGVRVRMLIDDMALDHGDLGPATLDQIDNIEVRVINPFSRNQTRPLQFLTRFGSVTRRMHNKSFTADNQITILGGRNIGNEYFEADPALAFSDLDVIAIGPLAQQASWVFGLYWNSDLSYPVSVLATDTPDAAEVSRRRKKLRAFVASQRNSAYLQALNQSALVNSLRSRSTRYDWGKAALVFDTPDKLVNQRKGDGSPLTRQMHPHLQALSDELIIFSPYFVPGVDGSNSLIALAQRGVRVRVLTNSLASSDVGAVHAGYSRYRRKLLRGGVELYEMDSRLSSRQRKQKRGMEGASKASLHAKSFILDRKELFIGSLNLDPRSVVENTEVGVILESPALAGEMAQWFDDNVGQLAFRVELVDDGSGGETLRWTRHHADKQQIYYTDPYTSIWRRIGIRLLSLLPIESQL